MDDVVSKIIDAIAAAEGVDPMELNYALQDHVDVDSIESLIDHSSDSWTLSFQVPNHSVTITGDSIVLIDGEVPKVEPPAEGSHY